MQFRSNVTAGARLLAMVIDTTDAPAPALVPAYETASIPRKAAATNASVISGTMPAQ